MGNVIRFISMAGFAILILLIILTIVSIFGGFEHPLSAPPT
jgi:hypothetical protein